MIRSETSLLDFRIDWGYAFVYSRRHYHPVYAWDGRLECEGGEIRAVYQLDYPYTWWGPVHTARETRLDAPEWKSQTRRGIAGIRVEAECGENATFTLKTAQGDFRFTAEQVRRDGRIVFPVGWKYSHCTVIVTRSGFLWFRQPPKGVETMVEAREMRAGKGSEFLNFARMDQVWIEPGSTAEFDVTLREPEDFNSTPPPKGATTNELSKAAWRIHLQAMVAERKDDPFALTRGRMSFELRKVGATGEKLLAQFRPYFRWHDQAEQILHDVFGEVAAEELPAGRHKLRLVNISGQLPLLVHRVSMRPVVRRQLEVIAPRWVLVGQEFVIGVRVLRGRERLEWEFDREVLELVGEVPGTLKPGLYEARLRAKAAAVGLTISVRAERDGETADGNAGSTQMHVGARALPGAAVIEAIYDLPDEVPEVKVGYDMTTVPHDNTGTMDHLLEYTWQTQLANLVCFRPFPMGLGVQPPELLERWGRYCREHGIYVQGINLEAGRLPEAAGEYFHAIGTHELSGQLYFMDPDNGSGTMREAAERYVGAVRDAVGRIRAGHGVMIVHADDADDAVHDDAGADYSETELSHSKAAALQKAELSSGSGTIPVAFGDASGGHVYALMAGADFLRAETMVAHTQQHCSQARAAAQAAGSGEWGCHIAIQHAKQPYLVSHLTMYFLSLMQPWMMGASFLYEEDSLFQLFKEERQGWDDLLTKGKREITRQFLRFAKTHPREALVDAPKIELARRTRGPQINIAYVIGRYAAPFNGFICGCEQDPAYSVWGKYGRTDAAWGHLQPEKAQQVLDVLMPGASTHPFRQRYDRRRFFFTGTPYGDFDQAPMISGTEYLSKYKLLLHLGWNTMEEQDYAELKEFVAGGGTLLIGVPQFSTHESRDYLLSMDDLALFRGGAVEDLCGVRITGRGVRYCGHWTAVGPKLAGGRAPQMSRVPSVSPDEDGSCHLAEVELHGAETVLVDAISRKPMLVENCLGAGRVLLMTTWCYAGHEELAEFSADVVAQLAKEHQCEYRVVDLDPYYGWMSEVFDTWWPSPRHAACGQLMALNTDWTDGAPAKPVQVRTPVVIFDATLGQKDAIIATCLPFGVLVPIGAEPHIEIVHANAHGARVRIHATGTHQFRLVSCAPLSVTVADSSHEIQIIAECERLFTLNWTTSTVHEVEIAVGAARGLRT